MTWRNESGADRTHHHEMEGCMTSNAPMVRQLRTILQ